MAAIVQRLERQIVVLDVEGSIPSSRPTKTPLSENLAFLNLDSYNYLSFAGPYSHRISETAV